MKKTFLKMSYALVCGIMLATMATAQNFPANGTVEEEIAIGGPSKDYLTLEFPRGTDQECIPFKGERRSVGGDIAKYGKAVLVIIFPKDCPYCIVAADQADAVIKKYEDKLTIWYVNQRLNGEGSCGDITEMSNKYSFVQKANFKFLDIYMMNATFTASVHYGGQDSYWAKPGMPSVYRIFDPKSKKVTGINYYVGPIESQIQEAIRNNFSPLANEAASKNLESYSLFPNPAESSITLNLNLKATANTVISVKNVLGVEVLRQELGTGSAFNQVLDLQSINKEMYMISVIADGVTVVKDKFVKQ